MWQTSAVERITRGWDKQRVLKEIRARVREGKSLATGNVVKERRVLYMAAGRFFGELGWQKAIIEVGFMPAQRRYRHWTPESFLVELKQLHAVGIPIHETFLRKNGYQYLVRTGQRIFGNWQSAITAAGFNYKNVAIDVTKWDRRKVLAEIQRLARSGVNLSPSAVTSTRHDLFSAAGKHFRSWSQALNAAGIKWEAHYRIRSTKAWIRSLSDDQVLHLLAASKTIHNNAFATEGRISREKNKVNHRRKKA